MKVSKVISYLQELNPNDEIVIGYWDKSIADSYIADENKPLTNDENSVKAEAPVEEAKPLDDSEQDFKKIKAYREALENKQNEL